MNSLGISTLDDPRLEAYRNLKDRELARVSGRFIAEGRQVVLRLLQSDFPVESVLLARRRCDEMAPYLPADLPLYVIPDELMQHVVGFKFHSGVIACGRRKPPVSLDAVMGRLSSRATLMVCPDIANTENLGALMRIAAGFGAEAMILGPQSCDPFYRQSIRVSMGAVFTLKLFQSNDLISDLRCIKNDWNIELFATVLDEAAEPLAKARRRRERLALVLGNEAQGLSPQVVAMCDRRVTIPMKLGTDSLNVAIAAAVCLYHFCRED